MMQVLKDLRGPLKYLQCLKSEFINQKSKLKSENGQVFQFLLSQYSNIHQGFIRIFLRVEEPDPSIAHDLPYLVTTLNYRVTH